MSYRPPSLTSVPGKVLQQLILEIPKHVKVIRSHQRGFLKGNSCLIHLLAFYEEIIGLADDRRAVNVFILTLVRFLTLYATTSS